LRTVIEGEVDDQAGAADRALGAARRRVEQGIAHIGIAIVYPADLRDVQFEELRRRLAQCELQVAVVTEAAETGFAGGGLDQLEIALRRGFEELLAEDIVGRATAALGAGVEEFAAFTVGKAGYVGRLAKTLGIRPLPRRPRPGQEEQAE
jgi:hypothetical protein